MRTPAEQETTLRELSDPELIAAWAHARLRLALGNGSKTAYDAVRAEYDRRVGTGAATSPDGSGDEPNDD